MRIFRACPSYPEFIETSFRKYPDCYRNRYLFVAPRHLIYSEMKRMLWNTASTES